MIMMTSVSTDQFNFSVITERLILENEPVINVVIFNNLYFHRFSPSASTSLLSESIRTSFKIDVNITFDSST